MLSELSLSLSVYLSFSISFSLSLSVSLFLCLSLSLSPSLSGSLFFPLSLSLSRSLPLFRFWLLHAIRFLFFHSLSLIPLVYYAVSFSSLPLSFSFSLVSLVGAGLEGWEWPERSWRRLSPTSWICRWGEFWPCPCVCVCVCECVRYWMQKKETPSLSLVVPSPHSVTHTSIINFHCQQTSIVFKINNNFSLSSQDMTLSAAKWERQNTNTHTHTHTVLLCVVSSFLLQLLP